MANSQLLPEEKRKEILTNITRDLLDAFGRGEITFLQMRDSAKFVLDLWKWIKTYDDLIGFYKALADRLSVFSKYELLAREEEYKQKETQIIQRLEKYISNFKTNS